MRYIILIVVAFALTGCMTVNVNNYGSGPVCINLDKAISTSTLPIQADGNTVPVSAVP